MCRSGREGGPALLGEQVVRATDILSSYCSDDVGNYVPEDMVLDGRENEASEERKGLWTDPAPIPPCVITRQG